MQLVRPEIQYLDSYVAALRRGWSPDTSRAAAAQEELQRIETDPAAFIAVMEDREAKGPMVTLPDGSKVKRLPSFRRWMWDTEFCGSISLRWQPGTTDLPPTCLGHIGYSVVPWKQRRGIATQALRDLLPGRLGFRSFRSPPIPTMCLPGESSRQTGEFFSRNSSRRRSVARRRR